MVVDSPRHTTVLAHVDGEPVTATARTVEYQPLLRYADKIERSFAQATRQFAVRGNAADSTEASAPDSQPFYAAHVMPRKFSSLPAGDS